MITPEQAVDRIAARFGAHPGTRALHARGVICSGSFAAAAEAGALTRAGHMQGSPVPVLARLSNGSGNPEESDRAPDVRGLAVSFELPDGARTDIVAQSAPRFPVKSPDAFIELIEASKRGPAMALKLPLFLLRNPRAAAALRANAAALKPPTSYADPTFYAVHAFRWVDAEGASRWVRYKWLPRPAPASAATAEGEADASDRHRLSTELVARLEREPVRFDLELQLAGPGDDPHDPTSVWGAGSRRVPAGELTLDAVADGHDGIIFDPLRLTDGIEPSEDPILHFRPRAYAVSYDRRTGAEHQRPPWARD